MLTKPTNVHKCIKVFCIINSSIHATSIGHNAGIYWDTTTVRIPLYRCKMTILHNVLYNILLYTHFFPFRMVTCCILAAQKIHYTFELLTKICTCVSYIDMYFKPCVLKI
jgi:hypothetical protein